MERIFLTTAIDYVNAPPHLGHALEKIQADVFSRYFRKKGKEVYFLTGTDEQSLKTVKAAKKEGISPKALVDKNSQKFFELKEILDLSFDDFIRTTEKRHIKGAQKLWNLCKKDIYKKKYKGLYCVGCEEFYKKEELENGLCPEHKTKPELLEEENYFFRLTKYQKKLQEILEKNKIEIVPEKRKNEILSFLKKGLEDICISRSIERSKGWGIDVPGDRTQKMWVWFDALSNYINALTFSENSLNFQKFWQKNQNIWHIIGKGILRFHAVYWPGILLSAGLNLPSKILVHGYITIEGQKMSKSLGNVISPKEVVKKTNKSALRWFLLREIPSDEDGDFSFDKLKKRYFEDLVQNIGNLFSRAFSLGLSYQKDGKKIEGKEKKFKKITQKSSLIEKHILNFKFHLATKELTLLSKEGNVFVEKKRLWENSKNKKEDFFFLFTLLKEIKKWLEVFLPSSAKKIENALNLEKKDKKITFWVKKKLILFGKI